MLTFMKWVESANVSRPIYIKAFDTIDTQNTAGAPGGDFDRATDDDYKKAGKKPGEEIPGIHYNWDVHISSHISSKLKGNKALWVPDYYMDYYHDSRNSADVYIEISFNEIDQIKAGYKDLLYLLLTPQEVDRVFEIMNKKKIVWQEAVTNLANEQFDTRGLKVSDISDWKMESVRVFAWNGLEEAIKQVSKEQSIRTPDNLNVKLNYVPDPRGAVAPKPGEDRESHLQRAATLQYGAPKVNPYDTRDDNDNYFKKGK